MLFKMLQRRPERRPAATDHTTPITSLQIHFKGAEGFYCPILQNVKNAEECYANTANLLPRQTVKIAPLQSWQLTGPSGHLLR